MAPQRAGSILAAALRRAERDLGFRLVSSSEGRTGFLVTSSRILRREQTQTGKEGGQVHPEERSLKTFLTIRSSSEW